MTPPSRSDDNKPMWTIGALLTLLCIGSWVWCWRTDQRVWIYFLAPFVVTSFSLLFSVTVSGIVQIRWNRPRMAPAIALSTLGLVLAIFLRSERHELSWGAPRLKSIVGEQLVFHDGKFYKLPIKSLTPAGVRQIMGHKEQRLTLSELRSIALMVVFDGHAKAGAAFLESAEQDARENKYGMWGGGSYEKDLGEYERLKVKLGLDKQD